MARGRYLGALGSGESASGTFLSESILNQRLGPVLGRAVIQPSLSISFLAVVSVAARPKEASFGFL